MRHGDANTVRVGISSQQQVRIDLVAIRKAKLQGLSNFRVGVGTRWEIAIRNTLLRDIDYLGDSDGLQDTRDAFETNAMKRRIDYAQA